MPYNYRSGNLQNWLPMNNGGSRGYKGSMGHAFKLMTV